MLEIIICMALAVVCGFLLGGVIFGRDTDGTLYFYTDEMDGEEYTLAHLDRDISELDQQKTITFKCVKLPRGFDITKLSQ